ncbi:hypothetical protein CSHISOI_09908 [Colletotrichum shisoi]|uniref:Uncharacterized protein n=1 Tax=Colletotrichum shisoi TaxID=2078593 RepID=A0A5Q4BFZ7_9PEZI|nr:hypothetical protein CSHISOI_09908 [Colletotrichum shisoi]
MALAWPPPSISSLAAVPSPPRRGLPLANPTLSRSQTEHRTNDESHQSHESRSHGLAKWPTVLASRGVDEIPTREELGLRYSIEGDNHFVTGPDDFFLDALCDSRKKTIQIPWVNNPSQRIGARAVLASLWKYELQWDALNAVHFTFINNDKAFVSIDKAWQIAEENNQLGDAETDGSLLVMYWEEAFKTLVSENRLGYMVQRMLTVYKDFDDYYIRSVQIGTRSKAYIQQLGNLYMTALDSAEQ